VRPSAPRRLDLDEIRARCPRTDDDPNHPFRGGPGGTMLTFGPRWAALGEVRIGADGEELALIEAPPLVRRDLPDWPLHPALLDVAISFGGRHDDGFFLPHSYGRMVVRAPLPARFYSHVRYTVTGAGVQTAEVTLVDETGVELVAISDFVRRRVDTDTMSAKLTSGTMPAEPVDVRGIAPAAGAAAFRRLAGADLGHQVVISAEPLTAILATVRRSPADRITDAEADTAAVDTRTAGTGADLVAVLCAIWAETIGVDRVEPDDDFFELGGNSLVAVEVIGRVSRAAGLRLPMRTLFETSTAGGMAARIDQLRATHQDTEPTIARLSRNQ
jgi:acyl carrier protein